jgi:hypothetical protein
MRKPRGVVVLLGVLVSFVPLTVTAQIATTGPAALAQQMPRIYGPYLAMMSRVRVLQKQEQGNPVDGAGVTRPAGQVPAGRQSSRPSSAAGTLPAKLDTTFHTVRPAFVPQQLAARLEAVLKFMQAFSATA